MEFERKNPDCKFSIPDRPTVRQQLEYFSLIGGAPDKNKLTRYWTGMQILVEEWKCDVMPDCDIALSDIDDPDITDIIVWAGTEVVIHLNSLESITKNS